MVKLSQKLVILSNLPNCSIFQLFIIRDWILNRLQDAVQLID